MPAHKKILFMLVELYILFYLFSPKVHAFSENFLEETLDSNIWDYYDNSGQITLNNGFVVFSRFPGASTSFPYLRNKVNIFPEAGSFLTEIKFKFLNSGNFGDGITISTKEAPNNGVYPGSNIPLYHTITIWQDLPGGLTFWNYLCNFDGTGCTTWKQVIPPYSIQNFVDHIVKISYSELGQYKIWLDNNPNPIFVSAENQMRPQKIWMGNSLHTGTLDYWTSFEVDYVKINPFSEPIVNVPIVFLPGLAGSWDTKAMLTGLPGSNWTIPSYVKVYQNLIDSLENAGYEENKDLFIFAYDWRKPLEELARDLDKYIDESEDLQNKKINFIGHSMGGLVARIYAQNHGLDNVNKIIPVGSPELGSTEVYGIWEGGEYWKDIWHLKAAASVASHNIVTGKNDIESMHLKVPSLKDLLPTYDFLSFDGVMKPWSSLIWKNDYLNGKNNDLSFDNEVSVVTGNGQQTIAGLRVQHRNQSDVKNGLWVDGKPIKNDPFIYGEGDDTVLSSSSNGSFSNVTTISSHHYPMLFERDGIEKVFDILGLDKTKIEVAPIESKYLSDKVFVVMVKSPGRLEVCDNQNICDEDLGIYDSTNKVFMLPGYNNEDLTVKVYGDDGAGTYRLEMANIDTVADWTDLDGELREEVQVDEYKVVRGSTEPKYKIDCFLYNWQKYNRPAFKNQGACVKFVEAKSR